MRSRGYDVWLDEMCMRHDVDMSMLQGIQSCSVFVCFVTAPYIDSVQKSFALGRVKSNCFKEWTLACQQGKVIIPVFLEPISTLWTHSVLCMYSGSSFRVEAHGLRAMDIANELQRCLTVRYGKRANTRRRIKEAVVV